jgi:protein SCO1/2
MKRTQIPIIALLALSVGFFASWMVFDSQPVELEAGLWFGEQAKTLPDFELIDHNGQALGKAQLRDKWSLMFFGYTHCPDICPTSLQTLSEMMNAIEDADLRRVLQVIFVSVDPERDGSDILKNYVQYFNSDFIGATAALPELSQLTKALGILHSRDKTSEDQVVYGVSHSASILLFNPGAEFAGLFSAPHDSMAMANDLSKIITHN